MTVSAEPEPVVSVTQPLMLTPPLSSRVISSIDPFTSGVPCRRAVCTAAIKLAVSDTTAFVKIEIAGAGGAGRVSHNVPTKPNATAQPPIVPVIHCHIRLRDLAASFPGRCGFFKVASVAPAPGRLSIGSGVAACNEVRGSP